MSQEKRNSEEKEYPMLEVTRVEIFPATATTDGNEKAFAHVVLNDQLKMTGLRILQGAGGLFVAYPNDPFNNVDYFRSLFYPITRQLRECINEIVISKYNLSKEEVCK